MLKQDIAIESKPHFKFILKDASGALEWQPGPDRLMKLWKTERTIVIEEDWEPPELQKATEGQCETENSLDEVTAEEEVRSSILAVGAKSSSLEEIPETIMDDSVGNDEGPVLVPGLTSRSLIDVEEEISG